MGNKKETPKILKPPGNLGETSGDLVRGLRLPYCGPFLLCMYYVCEKHKHTLYSASCVHSSVYSALCTVLRRARAPCARPRVRARARMNQKHNTSTTSVRKNMFPPAVGGKVAFAPIVF